MLAELMVVKCDGCNGAGLVGAEICAKCDGYGSLTIEPTQPSGQRQFTHWLTWFVIVAGFAALLAYAAVRLP